MPIHSTAVVDVEAQISETAEIGPYCVISGPVRIGPETRLGPYVQITGHTWIGAACRIHAGAVIGDVPQDRSYQGCISYCRIGNGTIIREHVTIHRGTGADSCTSVGDQCLLMAGSHVAHNCRVADNVVLVNGALLGGYVEVGRGAVIAGNAGIHQFVRIGELAMVGALAMIRQDVPPTFMVDERGLVVGVNRVGVMRAGLSADDRHDASSAYRLLCREPIALGSAIESLRSTMRSRIGHSILAFVSSESKRGILRCSPKRRITDAALSDEGAAANSCES